MDYTARNQRLREKLKASELDGILITRPENILYLMGISGVEGIYFLHQDGAAFFTDFRYIYAFEENESFFDVIECKEYTEDMVRWIKMKGLKRIGFESGHLTIETFNNWKNAFSDMQLSPCLNYVEDLRLLKDPMEQTLIRKSAQILGQIMDQIPDLIKNMTGITENGLAIEMEYLLKKAGAQRAAFDIIVATSERAALPHSTPTDIVIENEDLLLVDCGAVFQGYHSDMTRVMLLNHTQAHKIKDIYLIVREAQKAAMSLVSPGVPAKEIDLAARDIIKNAGFEEHFGHGTGHGVGLMIHEDPKINAQSKTILQKDMVFTIEPGIYLQNEFGIRWEDMILVTNDGYDSFTDIKWNTLEVI